MRRHYLNGLKIEIELGSKGQNKGGVIMWSDRYNYYNIQSDENYSQNLARDIVIESLLATRSFTQNNHQNFVNTDSFPWTRIEIYETKNGNFSASKNEDLFINLISIVCSKGEGVNQDIYIETFKAIAIQLGWTLYLEEDDDGNENIPIR